MLCSGKDLYLEALNVILTYLLSNLFKQVNREILYCSQILSICLRHRLKEDKEEQKKNVYRSYN